MGVGGYIVKAAYLYNDDYPELSVEYIAKLDDDFWVYSWEYSWKFTAAWIVAFVVIVVSYAIAVWCAKCCFENISNWVCGGLSSACLHCFGCKSCFAASGIDLERAYKNKMQDAPAQVIYYVPHSNNIDWSNHTGPQSTDGPQYRPDAHLPEMLPSTFSDPDGQETGAEFLAPTQYNPFLLPYM